MVYRLYQQTKIHSPIDASYYHHTSFVSHSLAALIWLCRIDLVVKVIAFHVLIQTPITTDPSRFFTIRACSKNIRDKHFDFCTSKLQH